MYSKNIKTQIFNPEGVVKLAYFQKKVEYPFKPLHLWLWGNILYILILSS